MGDTKKVAWNASQGLIMEISNRRSYANTFFVNGDIKKAFQTLISIKQSVIQSFNKEERASLEKIEKKFERINSALAYGNSHSFSLDVRKAHGMAKNFAGKIYAEYNEFLMDLLDKYGYLIGEQSDASRMKF